MGQISFALTNAKPSLHLRVFSLIYLSQTSCRFPPSPSTRLLSRYINCHGGGRGEGGSCFLWGTGDSDFLCGGSAKMAISNFQLVCAVAVVAIATFINLPAPRFSKRLEEWRIMGQYFNYKGNAIFYQGEVQWSSLDIGAIEYLDHVNFPEFWSIKWSAL